MVTGRASQVFTINAHAPRCRCERAIASHPLGRDISGFTPELGLPTDRRGDTNLRSDAAVCRHEFPLLASRR